MEVDQIQSSATPSSPEVPSSDASTETAQARKRTRSGKQLKPGARTVQNLTSEQLERKRDNDRLAQRKIRQRTKALIAKQQLEIDEMKQSGNPQRIAEVMQERDRLAQENMVLKEELRRLSEARDSPSQLHPPDTSSTAPAWSQVQRPPGVGTVEVGHSTLQSPPVASPGPGVHPHASGIQSQTSGDYSPVHTYSRQNSYSLKPSEPVAARNALYDYPPRSTMNEHPSREYSSRPQAPTPHTQLESTRPIYPQVPQSEGQPPQTAIYTGHSSQPRPTAFHHRRPDSPSNQHAPPGYTYTEPQWTTDRSRPLPKFDPHQAGGFYSPASSTEHSQQGPHPPQPEGQTHVPQHPHQPAYVLPPPSAPQPQTYPSGIAQYGPIRHSGYGHPNGHHYPPPHSPHPEQQRGQHAGPQPQPAGYYSYYPAT